MDRDPILVHGSGGGRRLVHPYLDDIVYPELPNRWTGFDWYALPKTRAAVVRTEGASAAAHYREFLDDVVVQEIWDAGSASISVEFWRLLREYRESILPTGDFIGWQPRDLSPYNYVVELLDVKVGEADVDEIQEHGNAEPYLLDKPLTLVFKLVGEARPPAGVISFVGH
ncbi:MAG: hypothetical protein ACRD5D_00565 [Candidatus Polarisedimenticolia bacterium]